MRSFGSLGKKIRSGKGCSRVPGRAIFHNRSCPSTPFERSRPAAEATLFEVGFIGWIVRVSFASNLDVSFDGSALGVVQPDFLWPSFVIADFTEEGLLMGPTAWQMLWVETLHNSLAYC